MRPLISILSILVLFALCCTARPVAADDDWPCFFVQEGPRFTASLERDVASSRQRMFDKILGDLETGAAVCPAAAQALADFRRDLTTAFDAALSKERVLDRLRPRWTRRWNAAQCAEVATLVKSAKADASAPADSPGEMLSRWLQSAAAAPVLRDKAMAQRIRETLVDVRSELDALQHDANAALAVALPPIIRRDKAATMTAIDACIAAEKARIAAEPEPADAPAKTPPAPAAALSIDPPAPFVVTRDDTGAIAILKITSSTGKPVPGEADGSLCQAMFVENPANAAHSQEFFNQRMSNTDSRTAAGPAASKLDIAPGQLFDRLGVRGLEFVAKEKTAAGAPQVRIYIAMLETPKGGTYLRCVTPDKGFTEALPQLRAIRDSMTPPR